MPEWFYANFSWRFTSSFVYVQEEDENPGIALINVLLTVIQFAFGQFVAMEDSPADSSQDPADVVDDVGNSASTCNNDSEVDAVLSTPVDVGEEGIAEGKVGADANPNSCQEVIGAQQHTTDSAVNAIEAVQLQDAATAVL